MAKRRSTRSWADGIVFPIACVIGAALSIWLFWADLNRALTRLNAEPVATITFKYRTAQRRFPDRSLWDRLRQESPVYEGDTVRTSDRAEATVRFLDGNSVVLSENTLIRIGRLKEGTREIGFDSGEISATAAPEGSGLSLRSGATRIAAGSGSAVSASAGRNGENDSLLVRILKGGATAFTADGGETGTALAEGSQASFQQDGSAAAPPSIVAAEPADGARFLKRDAAPVRVGFRWFLQGLDAATPLVLEVAADAAFTDVRARLPASGGEASADLLAGSWHWRIAPESNPADPAGAAGRLSVIDAPLPAAIAPAEGYEFRYRVRKPGIRFLWTADGTASAWELSIADNEAMENPVLARRCADPSGIVTSIGEGSWYWRVRPWYAVGGIGYSGASPVSRFSVSRSGELRAPEPLRPAANAIVNVAAKAEKSARFSWKNGEEAVSYSFAIASDEAMSVPAVAATVTGNSFLLDPARSPLPNGKWYWTVSQTDSEGNSSPRSAPRPFMAVDQELFQRAVFPPDGYLVAENLAADIRFTWKTNIPAESRFQVSGSPDFSAPVRDAASVPGRPSAGGLATGDWYWRVETEIEGVEAATPPRKLTIAPPLEAPKGTSPADSDRVIVRPKGSTPFSWEAVEGATYYSVTVYRGDEAVFENTALESTGFEIPLQSWKEGEYRWTVQPFADETPMRTRRSGSIAEQLFNLRKLSPCELVSPADGAVFDGKEAILHPGEISWKSIEKAAASRLAVVRDPRDLKGLGPGSPAPKGAVMWVARPAGRVSLVRLEEGRYWWTVLAETADGLDISALKPRSFTVTPVPRLPATQSMAPADGTVFDYDYLKKSRSARFEWAAVAGANRYRLVIRSRQKKKAETEALVDVSLGDEKSWTLADLGALGQGDFTWSVEASYRLEDGAALQRGQVRSAGFSISLPELEAPKAKGRRTMYGN